MNFLNASRSSPGLTDTCKDGIRLAFGPGHDTIPPDWEVNEPVIPNAMASTSPYADQWAQLKSVHYALSRVLDSTEGARLSDLDRERLQLLVDGLKSVTQGASGAVSFSTEPWAHGLRLFGIPDLREQISSVPEFDAWKKPSKVGFDHKLTRLVQVSEQFLQAQQLFATNVPREEFEVLRAIILALVSSSEVALHA